MSFLCETVASELATVQHLVHTAVQSLSRRHIAAVTQWIDQTSPDQKCLRASLQNELATILRRPNVPKENLIYILHEMLHHVRTIDAAAWRETIHQIMDSCAPLASYAHRAKIADRVLKYWIDKNFTSLRQSPVNVSAILEIAPSRQEWLLRYTVELVAAIFDSGHGGGGATRVEATSPGQTSGDLSIVSRGNASVGCPSSGGYVAAMAPGSGHTNTGRSSGHRSNVASGGASSGGMLSMSRGSTGGARTEELGMTRPMHAQRAKLAVTLSSCWILHKFFSRPVAFHVKELECLAFGAIMIAGKSESFFVRLSKILDNALALWTRSQHLQESPTPSTPEVRSLNTPNSASTPPVFGAETSQKIFPFRFDDVIKAETILLQALQYNCSAVSRPDQVFENWSLKTPCMVDIDILSLAQSRLINESHWIHRRLVLVDECVAALGYVVLVGIEKSRIQQVDAGFIFTSSVFKSTLQTHATRVIDFINKFESSPYGDAAVAYIQCIKSLPPIALPSEIVERKHILRLRNFVVEPWTGQNGKTLSAIRTFFASCSNCINISKVENCAICGSACGCYILAFENEFQVNVARGRNGAEFCRKKVTVERVAEKSADMPKDPRRPLGLLDAGTDKIKSAVKLAPVSPAILVAAPDAVAPSRSGASVSDEMKLPRGRSCSSGSNMEERGLDSDEYAFENRSLWSSSTRLKLLRHTPLWRWNQIAINLEKFWDRCKSENVACTLQDICARFDLYLAQIAVVLEYKKLVLDPRDDVNDREVIKGMEQAIRNMSDVMELYGSQITAVNNGDIKKTKTTCDESLQKRGRGNSCSSSGYQQKYEPNPKRSRGDDRGTPVRKNSCDSTGMAPLSPTQGIDLVQKRNGSHRGTSTEKSKSIDGERSVHSSRGVAAEHISRQQLDLELLKEVTESEWKDISEKLTDFWENRKKNCTPQDIAEHFDVSMDHINIFMTSAKFFVRNNVKLTGDQIIKLKEAMGRGYSVLRKHTGIPEAIPISSAAATAKPVCCPDDISHLQRIPHETWKRIARDIDQRYPSGGWSLEEIAHRFNVTIRQLRMFLKSTIKPPVVTIHEMLGRPANTALAGAMSRGHDIIGQSIRHGPTREDGNPTERLSRSSENNTRRQSTLRHSKEEGRGRYHDNYISDGSRGRPSMNRNSAEDAYRPKPFSPYERSTVPTKRDRNLDAGVSVRSSVGNVVGSCEDATASVSSESIKADENCAVAVATTEIFALASQSELKVETNIISTSRDVYKCSSNRNDSLETGFEIGVDSGYISGAEINEKLPLTSKIGEYRNSKSLGESRTRERVERAHPNVSSEAGIDLGYNSGVLSDRQVPLTSKAEKGKNGKRLGGWRTREPVERTDPIVSSNAGIDLGYKKCHVAGEQGERPVTLTSKTGKGKKGKGLGGSKKCSGFVTEKNRSTMEGGAVQQSPVVQIAKVNLGSKMMHVDKKRQIDPTGVEVSTPKRPKPSMHLYVPPPSRATQNLTLLANKTKKTG